MKDVVIIGGGIAGCITALSLLPHFNICLIDKRENTEERIGEALVPAAHRILNELNIFIDLSEKEQKEIYKTNLGMQTYWGQDKVQILDHLSNPDGMGINLNRKKFEKHLRKLVEKRGGNCIWNTSLEKVKYTEGYWSLDLSCTKNKTHSVLNAKFVVDASGRNSIFARKLGIQREIIDKLIASWSIVPNTIKNEMSSIISTSKGWWYTAITPNQKRIISFHTDADLIDKKNFKSKEHFYELAKAQNLIHQYLPKNKKRIDYKGIVSANSTKLKQVCGTQWAAIGDAAISFDPLSSQGMFNAMVNALQFRDLVISTKYLTSTEPNTKKEFLTKYTQQIENVWGAYMEHKNMYYSMEGRWKNAPFWDRRQNRIV